MDTTRLTAHQTAAAWIAGGAMWVTAGLIAAGSLEPLWIVADILLMIGLLGLRAHQFHGYSRGGRIGLDIAIVGRAVFVTAEVVAAIQNSDENLLLPLGALLTVVGMILYGVAVVRAGQWHGPTRFAPLAMGLYPFLVMFPYVAAHGGNASVAAISWWGLTAAGIGVAVLREAPDTAAGMPG